MHEILKTDSYKIMPWKNGLGKTIEILIDPSTSNTNDPFNWRISVATIAASGPFSQFGDYNRVIVPIRGGGISLSHHVQNAPKASSAKTLEPLTPYYFDGAHATHCELQAGPAQDFNVIVGKKWGKATVTCREAASSEPISIASQADTVILYCVDNPLLIGLPNKEVSLDSEETLVLRKQPPHDILNVIVEGSQRNSHFIVVELKCAGD